MHRKRGGRSSHSAGGNASIADAGIDQLQSGKWLEIIRIASEQPMNAVAEKRGGQKSVGNPSPAEMMMFEKLKGIHQNCLGHIGALDVGLAKVDPSDCDRFGHRDRRIEPLGICDHADVSKTCS